jgi:hypothetical protein
MFNFGMQDDRPEFLLIGRSVVLGVQNLVDNLLTSRGL